MSLPIVALIGQTNAGKSSLLNRFAGQRVAIVAREAGTTRDNVIARISATPHSPNLNSHVPSANPRNSSINRNHPSATPQDFLLIDTAGLKNPEDDFEAQIQDQIADAVDSADLICLTLDSSKYPDDRDRQIAKTALRSRKPVFLLLNKSDLGESLPDHEFLKLGIKPEQTFRVSATTGQGTDRLKNAILQIIAKTAPDSPKIKQPGNSPVSASPNDTTTNSISTNPHHPTTSTAPIKIALIGRPNVGKSSLFNSLAKKQQAIVSSRQGTTRDINRLQIKYHRQDLEILDTAGLRRPGKREVGIEKFSALRTLAAIEESDLSALLIDATEPSSKLDQSLAGQIVETGKSILIILTKADLKTAEEIDRILDDLERDFNFLPYAPVLITSSETGKNVTKLFELATTILRDRQQKIPTSELNKILNDAIVSHAPAGLKNTRPKPKYIVQTDSNPPWFVVHGHDLGLLHWSWKRYLERKIREQYPFVGTPIFFSFREG